jgi:hypothetical protein
MGCYHHLQNEMLSELPQCISNSLETKRSTINMGILIVRRINPRGIFFLVIHHLLWMSHHWKQGDHQWNSRGLKINLMKSPDRFKLFSQLFFFIFKKLIWKKRLCNKWSLWKNYYVYSTNVDEDCYTQNSASNYHEVN